MSRTRTAVVALVGLILVALIVVARGGFGPPGPLTGDAVPGPPPAPPEGAVDGDRGATKPNILVIVWDTVRADRMSLYGHERPTTPNLDRLAESALVFENAHSPAIWTLPSHASMFTGLPPETTGADERWLWLDHGHTTVAEHFSDAGWDTFSFAANTLLSPDTNLLQGYRVKWNTFRGERIAPMALAATKRKLIEGDRSHELAPDWTPPEHGAKNAEWARAAYKEAGPLITKGFLKWVDERRSGDEPFLAYLNMMEAHTPRLPSMESRRAVMADDPALIDLGLQTDAAHIRLHFYNFDHQVYSDRELAAIRGVYDAALRDLDRATAALLQGLKERGALDDTIVILTSDHGENLGDHGLFNHRFSLWETLTHVPLVVWGPGIEPGRTDTPVSTQDLFATLCRLTDQTCPDTVTDRTWLDDAPGPAVTWLAEPLRREIETVKDVHPDVAVEPWMRSGHALVHGHHKVQRLTDGTLELYDLAADPAEQHPIDDTARRDALVEQLDAWVEGVAPYDPASRGPKDDPAHVRASQEELRAQLEALGYTTEEDDDVEE